MPDIRIVSITQPLLEGVTKPEDMIVYTARVSNPANQMNMETGPKLIEYLLTHKHMSPFEMVDFTVEIGTSRAIAQQILRHWSFSFQEFSQRYAQANSFVPYEARRQDPKNRQNSVDDMSDEDKEWFRNAQLQIWEQAYSTYEEALRRGIAKEQARFVLPLNTETRLYMKGSVRDWIFYLQLRRENGTQKEHADIAQGIIDHVFIPHLPTISSVLGWTSNNELR